MKKSKYITILLASLFFCINTYAQNAESAQGLNELTQNGQAPQASDSKTSTTKTATYTSEKGTITITSKTTDAGVSHSVSVQVPEGKEVSMEELVKSVANAMNRDGGSTETKATLLAISQAVNALAAKGELPTTVSGNFSMNMTTSSTAGSDTSSNTTVSISAGDKTVSAEVTTSQDANGAYSVSGSAGDTAMNVTITPTEDSYVVSGEVAGVEVKSTVSNQADVTTSLDSATVTTETDGKVVSSTTTVNNADGTHTVTETDASGNTSSSTYEGTAETPVTPDTSSSTSSSSSSVDNLGGVGDETVAKDPTNNDTMTETEVEIPDSTIVAPEEFTTPETITE